MSKVLIKKIQTQLSDYFSTDPAMHERFFQKIISYLWMVLILVRNMPKYMEDLQL